MRRMLGHISLCVILALLFQMGAPAEDIFEPLVSELEDEAESPREMEDLSLPEDDGPENDEPENDEPEDLVEGFDTLAEPELEEQPGEPVEESVDPESPAATGIRLEARKTLGKGEKYRLTPVALDDCGMPIEALFTFRSSNKKIVRIDSTGLLRARKPGRAKVTVTADGVVKTTVTIRVVKAPVTLKLSAKRLELSYDVSQSVGSAARLSPKLSSHSASAITYSGYDPAVVNVSDAGVVTAVGTGSTTITARTFNGKKARCVVRVHPAPETLNLPAALTLWKDKKYTLRNLLPDGTWAWLSYASSDSSVVTVSAKGVLTCRKMGEAVITVSTFNGTCCECLVTVAPYRVTHPVQAVAHRGGSGYWRENTLKAFSNVSSLPNVGVVELDVRSTRDGVQVVHHDAFFWAKNHKYTLSKHNFSKLKKLKPSLCTLSQALKVLSSTDLEIQLELKGTANVAACMKAIRHRGLTTRTIYISSSRAQLRRVRRRSRSARIGLICKKLPGNLNALHKQLHLYALSVNYKHGSRKLVERMHRKGIRVGFWTVNRSKDIQRVFNWDSDFIVSDYPARVPAPDRD